ncbi:transmembrane amino acid transporter protein-domain-containing protein [Microdochium trichocladiopsis]|uniref:Transmembrane amino acid transporter protein-domain-containing protein n=1 Tax=Microdochium trichocladiopsis TaxID=1682393 RepID=A0A9P9BU61_9PEZI|nr:transmembrane amino acid transporter protein-domain-containing protein [Microdochium trichocladiopsis]KAH7037767.1 transmembrane amino acid transporter protein-domain-containing protein [Microdochium trichocladiopsis]
MAGRQPTTWDEYEGRPSPGRSDSGASAASVHFEQQALLGDRGTQERDPEVNTRQRRRSSVSRGLAALTDIGGVNSIRSFGRSWQRAAVFPEVIPQRPSFVFAPDQEPAHTADLNRYGRTDIEATPRASLLRQHLEASTSETAVTEAEDDGEPMFHSPFGPSGERKRQGSGDQLFRHSSPSGSMRSNSIFQIPPHLAAPDIVGSYGSFQSYGTIDSDASHRSMLGAGELWRQQQESGASMPDGERPAILVREVEQEGKIVLAVSGQSTLPQTVLNSTNVLIGVGMLSLPMGLRYAGWVPGLIMLGLCAAVTSWTAGILAKCMDLDPTIITFSDIAYISFGSKARIMTSILFTLELLAACVALIVLFADSLVLLFPGSLTVTEWKVLCTVVLLPLQFAPLALLSFTSFVGILCCMSIVIIVILCGLLKATGPGSLIEPAATYLFPANWMTLPLSLGLLMSPWGGHGVFPNIYRDMRHPHKYTRAVSYTFGFTFGIDSLMAVLGYVMFGDGVRDEITANILDTTGYPNILNIILVIVIAIIPLTKIPLNAQPINATIEVVCGLRQQHVAGESSMVGLSATARGLLKALVRVGVLCVFLAVSIAFPAFDSIMAFMGSALCFTICVTLPLAFYLKLFGHELSAREKLFTWCVMLTSLTLSIVGTVWAFLPKDLIGATE